MRFLQTSLLLGMGVLSAHFVQAQSLAVPDVPRPVQPKAPPAVTGPSLNQPVVNQSAVPDNPSQRTELTSPIQSVGPAAQVNKQPQPVTAQTPVYGSPVEVTDARGMTISGAVQVGPNRVYVPSTGKYHNTLTAGQQQQIVP